MDICIHCQRATVCHHLLDAQGMSPICGLCLIVWLAAAEREHCTLTVTTTPATAAT